MISKGQIYEIQKHLEVILDEPGSILYSSINTLNKGDIYTMGLNPGGDGGDPLSDAFDIMPFQTSNAYLDETWSRGIKGTYPKGQHPLQKNMTGLLSHLGYDAAEVFSTNLIFTKSRGEDGAYYPERAHICWKVHQEFINIVDPMCFIVFGNSEISPFSYMKTKYNLEINDSISSGHGNWLCHSCTGIIEGKNRVLIGVPHLSRYCITYHVDVMNWIKSKIQ